MAKNLSERGLNYLHEEARDFEDLVNRLKSLGKGIGDTTVGIFMREMIGIWDKARPYPTPLARLAASNLGIGNIEEFWREKLRGIDYAKFESMLVEIGKLCRRNKCFKCPAKGVCNRYSGR